MKRFQIALGPIALGPTASQLSSIMVISLPHTVPAFPSFNRGTQHVREADANQEQETDEPSDPPVVDSQEDG